MTWTLRLQYIAILIVICAGFAFPLIWLLLITLVQSDKKKDKEDNQNEYKKSSEDYADVHIPSDGTEGTKARIYSIDYEKYRESPEWQVRRRAVLKRDNYICQQCKATDVPLEVHHVTYENIGEEPIEDLVSLCRICHQNIHDTFGYDKTGKFPLL